MHPRSTVVVVAMLAVDAFAFLAFLAILVATLAGCATPIGVVGECPDDLTLSVYVCEEAPPAPCRALCCPAGSVPVIVCVDDGAECDLYCA
jgi:hypothetical protein